MSTKKITLNGSRDIPFNKLILSQTNVRRTKAGVSIEDLAEDIAHRNLLQSLSVRPVLDESGQETGMFEVPAGGRRYRALALLVKQKRLAKTAPVPCIIKGADDTISAEEDSLAENTHRVALHPLDQFRAFQTLREQGLDEEEIAARFFVTPIVVKQRLKLAAVSDKLLDAYAEDEITLEQLMAFTVANDQARQEQAWESLSHSHNQEPYAIRRMLTEGAVPGSDKRAQFVGIEAYETAGGAVIHDLFEDDDGGWLQDAALLDRLATEKLKSEAAKLADEGWKWITVAASFPYGHTSGLRRLSGHMVDLSEEEYATREALRSEYNRLETQYAQAEELPGEVDQRLGEIETALDAFENRPVIYEPSDIPRAGVFVSIDGGGGLLIERGYVRADDDVAGDQDDATDPADDDGDDPGTTITVAGESDTDTGDAEDGIRPLSDRLVTELTTHRTLALRDALAGSPDLALIAVLHVLCLGAFYRFASSNSCLEITPRSADFVIQAPALKDSIPAKALDTRHETWSNQLPERPAELWDTLAALDRDSRMALFAHCASLTVNVVKEPHQRRSPGALAHGDTLARALHLDMAAVWSPTADNYLGRVSKARILEAVREAKGEASAQLIDHLKKQEMATEAERLLAGTGWLPEPLRLSEPTASTAEDNPAETLPAFLAEDEDDSDQATAAE